MLRWSKKVNNANELHFKPVYFKLSSCPYFNKNEVSVPLMAIAQVSRGLKCYVSLHRHTTPDGAGLGTEAVTILNERFGYEATFLAILEGNFR